MSVQAWKDVAIIGSAIAMIAVVAFHIVQEKQRARRSIPDVQMPPYYMAWSDIGELDEEQYPQPGHYFVYMGWVHGPFESDTEAMRMLTGMSTRRTARR